MFVIAIFFICIVTNGLTISNDIGIILSLWSSLVVIPLILLQLLLSFHIDHNIGIFMTILFWMARLK